MVEELIKCRPHGATSEEHVVHEHDIGLAHVEWQIRGGADFGDGFATDIVALEGDVCRAGGDGSAEALVQSSGQATVKGDAAVSDSDQSELFGIAVLIGQCFSQRLDRLLDGLCSDGRGCVHILAFTLARAKCRGQRFCVNTSENELGIALEAVRAACTLCQDVRSRLVSEDTLAKKDKSPVTVADFGAQAVVLEHLATAFPEIPCVGEEDAGALREHDALREQVLEAVQRVTPELDEARMLAAIDRGNHAGGAEGVFWTLDPIDGTKGFLRNEQYAVALALIEDGQVRLGVLGCPNMPVNPAEPDGASGCLFFAARGTGAFMLPLADGAEPRRIEVSALRDLEQAAFCESVESGHTRHDASAQIAEKLGVCAEPVRMDSQCKYAALARGEACIYLRLPTRPGYVERIWDHAAGWIVITEAGGQVGDVTGSPLDFSCGRGLENNRGVVASTPAFYDEVVRAVRSVLEI